MRFCESCGNALQPKDQFCGKCGAPVKREDAKRGKGGKKKELKNKKAWIIGITVLVMCVAMSVVGGVVIKPYCEKLSDYKEAESLLKDGEYSKAYKTFEKLEDFKDAKSRQLECQYGMAGDYYKEEKFEEAREIYEQLGKYNDSSEWVTKCQYEIAKALYQENKYEDAIEAFTEIETYKDAKKQIQNCYYELGEEACQTSDYESAMSYLGKAPDVEAAKELYQMLEWRAAYIEVLEEEEFDHWGYGEIQTFREYTDGGFSLAYIDDDTIPELIVYLGSCHADSCWIYTMVDGHAEKVMYDDECDVLNVREQFGSYGRMEFVPKQSLICSQDSGMGAFSGEYYKLEDAELGLVVRLSYYDDYGKKIVYRINGEKVSKKEYMEEKEKLEQEYNVSEIESAGCTEGSITVYGNDDTEEEMMDQAIRTFCEK